MKTNRFYLYSGLACVVLFTAFTIISSPLIIKSIAIPLVESEITSLKQNVDQVASLSSTYGSDETSKEDIKSIIQNWTENSHTNMHFISIIDWSGKIISYPETIKINNIMDGTQSASSIKNVLSAETIYQQTINATSVTNEIAYMAPVAQTDWIIIGHFNTNKLNGLISIWKRNLYLFFTFLGLSILLFVFIIIRRVSNFYDTQLSDKLFNLKDEVVSLSKLNESLSQYQQNLGINSNNDQTPDTTKETSKKRLLTYVRNELLPVFTDDIAYIYVDHTITYIVQKDGKRSTTNESLDLIYSYLDERSFFRVNRQVIVAISAIKTITKFGNSKLNIQVTPESEIDIIIGKNKAAAFKQWLDS
ncbi:LytTR family DNA-binding domain-containing protein [Winogradskyella sp.]|uniref:LytR/AlgR family response regulator transcription factor n=1 Tax=Winogradskyella sp. TaxID=1883156 RepID=UPI0026133F52|nr:LytTR family DNA-binding domain-containing protein [Winogradskyella sp.]